MCYAVGDISQQRTNRVQDLAEQGSSPPPAVEARGCSGLPRMSVQGANPSLMQNIEKRCCLQHGQGLGLFVLLQ